MYQVVMALGDTEKAAVKGFLQSKRGSRALQPHVVTALLAYFAGKDMSLRELPTSPPPNTTTTTEEDWYSEWIDYAVSSPARSTAMPLRVRASATACAFPDRTPEGTDASEQRIQRATLFLSEEPDKPASTA